MDEVGNRTTLARRAPAPVSIPELFAEHVQRDPGAVAVSFQGSSHTYRELDEAANRLAHLLAGQGAGPGQAVALLFSRSPEAVIAMLAVLKTGPPIWRSTRPCRTSGSGSCSPTRHRSPQ